MMCKNNRLVTLSVVALLGAAVSADARPNINNSPNGMGELRTTANCRPAEAAIDLDINNVRARLMTGGDMWWDIGLGTARYEVPKGSNKNSLFAGSVWIGGYDNQGQLKVAAQTYRQDGNDYWPGPLDATANVDAATCSDWDRFWKINRSDINSFREMGASSLDQFQVIKEWPAKGNQNVVGNSGNTIIIPQDKDYAPFVDVSPDGIYDPSTGDYPDIDGDQYIWWVFNDMGNTKQQSKTTGIGVEVHASAFAYATKDFLNDATFYNYRLINRGNVTLDSTYIATWTDADLGYYRDDYIGCDTVRGLGILYNGTSVDGTGAPTDYGSRVPMVGIDFFKGPMKCYDSAGKQICVELKMEAFTYYNNDGSVIGNPRTGGHIYNYMTGSITNGQRFVNDFKGPGQNSTAYGQGPVTRFVFFGDPGNPSEWSECTCNNPVQDRRFVHSSGPFTLKPGVVNDITIGAVWVDDVGGCPNTSFKKIRAADDLAQELFERDFKTIEGPEAPRVVVREMNRKLVMYLINDPSSNNYKEGYGRNLSEQKYRVASSRARYARAADSLYKFEGYRVFQVKNSEVQAAQIFNENGQLNNDLAREIFQVDLRNGVQQIVNYEKDTDISDTTWRGIIKVNGADSGIKHSFEVTLDQFATGTDKRLVNYRNYYFIAIAYAYNNFAPFDINNVDSTEITPYIESSHGANGTPIPVVIGMPNAAHGDVNTVLNSDYGDGVIIKRIQGVGNARNNMDLSEESENEAVETGFVAHPVYKQGLGPVDIKVVDPAKIVPASWELHINGNTDAAFNGIAFNGSWSLVNTTTGETIFAETELGTPNEQILEDYGLAVNVNQVRRPGDDQINNNGYITSDIRFADSTLPWLMGVSDQEGRNWANWIRSGHNNDTFSMCNFDDYKLDTVGQFYENLLRNNSLTRGTWAPYALAASVEGGFQSFCGFGVALQQTDNLRDLQNVDVVFTKDKTKWTRCVVLEMQETPALAEGGAAKFDIRKHGGWNGEVDANGRPVYGDINDQATTGMSWFPGYAINTGTGERLNILFGEDSYLKMHNGNDMIWNPTSTEFADLAQQGGSVVFGGKHYIYVSSTKYDEGASFKQALKGSVIQRLAAYRNFMWVGIPLLNPVYNYLSLEEGFIPTETRLRFRVERPYAKYVPAGMTPTNDGNPIYQFSTHDLAPSAFADNPNADKQALLDRIHAVPNPYYGYTGYEQNRLDTRVRIINLPRRATVSVYSLDGTLIRRLQKEDANVSFLDWDLRNANNLPIASGMYLIHVKADGIGETVLRWFGAMRPLDISTY